jgi:hypothetical protein
MNRQNGVAMLSIPANARHVAALQVYAGNDTPVFDIDVTHVDDAGDAVYPLLQMYVHVPPFGTCGPSRHDCSDPHRFAAVSAALDSPPDEISGGASDRQHVACVHWRFAVLQLNVDGVSTLLKQDSVASVGAVTAGVICGKNVLDAPPPPSRHCG